MDLRKEGVAEDGGMLDAALTYAEQHTSATMPPFWFVPLDSDLSVVQLLSWDGGGLDKQHRFLDQL